MRVLPDVHEALRQNDPSKAAGSQPVLKKAPPTTGRGRPASFYSGDEPPRIGTAPVQPPPPPSANPEGCSSLRVLLHPPDSYSHDSRPSTSSTYRGTSKAYASQGRVRQLTSIHCLNQLNRVRPTSKNDTRHFHMINSLHRQCLWHHLPQLTRRG